MPPRHPTIRLGLALLLPASLLLLGARGCELFIVAPADGALIAGTSFDAAVSFEGAAGPDAVFEALLNGADVSTAFALEGPGPDGRTLASAAGLTGQPGANTLAVTVRRSGPPPSAYSDVHQFGLIAAPDPTGVVAEPVTGAPYPSLAFNPDGYPYVSYGDAAEADLRVGWYDPRYSFRSAALAGLGGAGAGDFSSMAVRSDGAVLIAFHNQDLGRLELATARSLDLAVEVVDASGERDVGSFCSLRLDAAEEPVIAYHDATLGLLKLARRSSGGWTITVIDGPDHRVGRWASLALAGDGQIGIAYYDETDQVLRYAEGASAGTMTIELADSTPFAGQDCSLAFNGLGMPSIAYQDGAFQDLRYAQRVGGVWGHVTVVAQGSTGYFPSLVMDPQGHPHIAYYDLGQRALLLARDLGGGFETELIDGGGGQDRGRFVRLALAPDGHLAVVYLDATGGRLLYRRLDR